MARMKKDEQIGLHKRSIDTLLKERQEMIRIISIIDQLLQAHAAALHKHGVRISQGREEKLEKALKYYRQFLRERGDELLDNGKESILLPVSSQTRESPWQFCSRVEYLLMLLHENEDLLQAYEESKFVAARALWSRPIAEVFLVRDYRCIDESRKLR